MRILFTIQTLEGRAGGSLYVRDFALELLRLGHHPAVYTTRAGALADEIRALTIPVITRLSQLTGTPDIIHGNAPFETIAALLHFPQTPAIFVCHGWEGPDALAPKLPRILRFLAVDETCLDRLLCHDGIPESDTSLHFNPVDLSRFRPRSPLPERPQRALVFSNQATGENYVDAIRRACERFSIALDVIGQASGNSSAEPETILGGYDIVFAKARCALEALASGTAVVVCDTMGLASLVTTANLAELRRRNFGRRSLRNPITAESIAQEIARYNAADAAQVSATVRTTEGLAESAQALLAIYREVIETFRSSPLPDWRSDSQAVAAFLESVAPFSNTFYIPDRLSAAEREVDLLRRKIRGFEESLRMTALSSNERQGVRLAGVAGPSVVPAEEYFSVIVEAENNSTRFLASHLPHPVRLSYHWLSADRSTTVLSEGERTALIPVLYPKDRVSYSMAVRPPGVAGRYCLRVTLVQEGIAWFDGDDGGQFLDIEIVVN